MDNLRFEVVKEAFRKRPVELEIPKERKFNIELQSQVLV